jgi:hypothetical protein
MTKRKVDVPSKSSLDSGKASDTSLRSGMTVGKQKIGLRARAQTRTTAQASLTIEQQVKAIGREIKSKFGVTVAAQRRKAPNPYQMTSEESAQILKKAGILTDSGKLSASYK